MSDIINNKKLIYTLDELKDLNLSYYKINQLIIRGKLRKLNKKHYENLEYHGDFNEFCLVQAYVERGVVCLISAASFYNLTSTRPVEIDMAIHRKDKAYSLPDWPTINIYYFSEARYKTGIEKIKEGFDTFKIYNLEKTVIDIILNREKIGIEETKEILHNYLKRTDRNLNNLFRYSKLLGCEYIVKKYMEVLL